MDMMLFATSVFTVTITMSIGYLVIQKFFPSKNMEIEISNAYKEGEYQTIVTLTEDKELVLNNSFNIYSCAAQSRMKLGLFIDAVKWWESLLVKIDLTSHDKLFVELKLGDCYFAMNDLKNSKTHYSVAEALVPGHEKANHKLATVFYHEKMFDLCRKTLSPILKKNPALIDSRKLYAECLASMGLYSKAIRHYGLLERKDENTITYNYAATLNNLKIWEKAYEAYSLLLKETRDQSLKEIIICDLVKISIAMKKYHESLGLIDTYLNQVQEIATKFELRYMRASIFFLRGDQIIALREYEELHKENPLYKDLENIIVKNKKWLAYSFLSNYYTSNESLFESLVMRLTPPGLTIFRRASNYFMGVLDKKVFVFYREIREINDHFLKEMDNQIFLNVSKIEEVEIWSLEKLTERQALRSYDYRIISRTDDDFLVQVNLAVATIDFVDDGQPMNFVEGMRNVHEVIPIVAEDAEVVFEQDLDDIKSDPIVENILNKKHTFLDDELLSKALE